MTPEQKDMIVTEHFREFCAKVASEVGTHPLGAILIVEWPDSSGSMALQLLPDLPRPMMLKIIDGLSRKFSGLIQRMKTMVNTAPAEKKDIVQ